MAIIKLKAINSVPPSHIGVEFLQMMVNRACQAFFKYGHINESNTDGFENAKARMKLYKKTGNTEWLIDAARYLQIEYVKPSHPKAHFRATSTEESPGSIKRDGRVLARKEEKYGTVTRRHEGD